MAGEWHVDALIHRIHIFMTMIKNKRRKMAPVSMITIIIIIIIIENNWLRLSISSLHSI